ncbi:MAG: FKBP-type peptidyl-prolyl cis-trans isomerase [Candidatus Altiarchaeota archaeon]
MGEEENIPIEAAAKGSKARKRKSKPSAEGKIAQTHAAAPQKDSNKPMPKELIIGAVIVLVAVAGMVVMMSQEPGKETATTTTTINPAKEKNANLAEKNDIVTVDYTGFLENGTVFDSSNLTIAKDSGIQNPLRTYEPLTFTLGYGSLIAGFEEAVEGMRVGQDKEVLVSPEKGYGQPDKRYIQVVEKQQRSPIVQNVTVEKFRQDIGKEPIIGLEFILENKSEFELTWPMKVLAVSNDIVTFRYMPEGNATLNTVFGPAQVYGTDTDIIIQIEAQTGQKVVTLMGPAKVIDVNSQNLTLDFNPELAGKNLKFRIKLLGVAKQPTVSAAP